MRNSAILGCFGAVFLVSPAAAYVGPGLGLGAIAVVFGVIVSIFLALASVVWYPLKRLLGLKKKKRAQTAPDGVTPNA